MANINVQVKREEALKRLQILKEMGMVYTPAIKCFKNGEDIGIFENQGVMKAVYYQVYLNTGDGGFYDNLKKAIEEFEAEEEAVVYLVLVTHTVVGTLCHMFHVSDNEDEWEMDREDLKQGYAFVYGYNMEAPIFSECGDIAFKMDSRCGGPYAA